MRVAIITYHRALNYGAVLQAYALQSSVQKLLDANGGECRMLDYHCPAIEDMSKTFHKDKRILKDIIKFIPNRSRFSKKKERFADFRREFIAEEKFALTDAAQTNNAFDVFITGSDQLWNYKICGDDDTYFLNFVTDNLKKYSYAVSLGTKELFNENKERILKNVKGFSTVSFREKICIEEFEVLTSDIRTDIDPTLLVDACDWEKVFPAGTPAEKYILLYCVAPPKDLISVARELSAKTGLKVVFLTDLFSAAHNYKEFDIRYGQGPREFLQLIKNAEYVLTTSFHGTVFSIKFHKHFYSETDNNGSHNDRIDNLLNLLGIPECSDRSILSPENVFGEEKWKKVDDSIDRLKEKSISYLADIVLNEENN